MKALRRLIVLFLFILVLVLLALGPGMSGYIQYNSKNIVDKIKRSSGEHIIVDKVQGNYFSGLTLKKVVVYADQDPEHLPFINAETIRLRMPLLNIINGDFKPSKIEIYGFNAVLHIRADGTLVLPEWSLTTAGFINAELLNAGFIASGQSDRQVKVFWYDGILEIIKRYPIFSQSVDITFTDLNGLGLYKPGFGFRIDSFNAKYLGSTISIIGLIPTDPSKNTDLATTVQKADMESIFTDINPLFGNGEYLPSGSVILSIFIKGTLQQPEIEWNLKASDAIFGNVKIDAAEASGAYSAGFIDLTEVTGRAYYGDIKATGKINMLTENPTWDMSGTFKKIHLADYLNSNNYYAYELDGEFDGSIKASGDFSNPESLICDSSITSSGGKFLTPFSERFTEVAGGTTPVKNVTPEDLADYELFSVDANIEDEIIHVDHFKFISEDIVIDSSGTVGFDHSIGATGELTVPLSKAKSHPRFSSYVSFLPDSLDRASLDFNLTGSLENVKFNAQPGKNLLMGLINQGGGALKNLGGALKGIGKPKEGD